MLELTRVSGSTNVAASGYMPSHCLMLVEYQDGSLYARTGVTPARYMAFLAAASPGRFLGAMTEPVVALRANTAPNSAPLRPDVGQAQPAKRLTLDDLRQVKSQTDPGSDFAIVRP